jgi:hypothetical protein
VLQYGAAPVVHCESVVQAAVQSLSNVSQAGAEAGQSAEVLHPTQVKSGTPEAPLVLHAGVAPVQAVAFVLVHCLHRFAVVSQAGDEPEQLASLVHCTQLSVVRSQAGASAGQPVWFVAVHCTQVLVAVSQAGTEQV